VIGSAGLMLRLSRDFGKQENVAALRCDGKGVGMVIARSVSDEAIQPSSAEGLWIASRSLSSGRIRATRWPAMTGKAGMHTFPA
jgi:hypothetical protein